ncbi:MAG: sel1 repeat family protein [Lentisphaeria bacterium]|nr:sel1 repeat family protein [Lentisphaeria bacterium]
MKKKIRVILLFAIGVPLFCLHMFAIFLVIDMETDVMPLPFDYDDPEPLLFLGQRTQQYIRRAYPKDSAERKEALQALEDIALLDVSEYEKKRLLHERFPEESFWTEDVKDLLKQAESGDAEAQFQLGCLYFGHELGLPPDELKILGMEIDEARGRCIEKSGYMAVKWFRRAALQGHVKAQNALAQSYLNGSHPVAGDRAFLTKKAGEMISGEVKKWCRMAVANGDPFVMLERFDSNETNTSADFKERKEKALDILSEAARQGNVKAMLAAAHEMRYGDGRQREEAEEWYRQAAELGSVEAMMDYANVCESREWRRIKAEIEAKQEAAEEKGEEYEEEEIVVVSEEADRWRRKAFDVAMKHLDEGSAKDLYLWTDNMSYYIEPESSPLKTCLGEYLGEENTAAFLERTVQRLYDMLEQDNREIYYISRIISNVHKEFEDLEILQSDRPPQVRYAEAGVPLYQSIVAVRMLKGNGVPENKPEAIKRLRIGAGFCSMAEERYLGECYMNGDGVPQDTAEGVKWLKKAALHGSGDAMWLLRNHYRESWNPYQALKWTIRSELHYSCHYESPVEYCSDMLKGLWGDLEEAWLRFVD